jgi:hypothetical protein
MSANSATENFITLNTSSPKTTRGEFSASL